MIKGKTTWFCFLILVGTFQLSRAQIDRDAVIRLFNVTFNSGGVVTTASVTTQAFANLTEAQANNLGANTIPIQDGCSFSGNPCDSNANCTVLNATSGVIQCSCPAGFNMSASTQVIDGLIPDGTNCPDIDECSGNSTACGQATDQCFNSIGGYSCNCTAGYEYISNTQLCEDINECNNDSLNNCHMNATCTNASPNYTCQCDAGFTGDGFNCTETDQCVDQSITCGSNGVCVDPVGQTYFCNCSTGYTEDTTANPRTCQDTDECTTMTDNCDANAACTNTPGSFTCACMTGYNGDGITCTDIDECATNPCDTNANCTNSDGSFTCTCNTGYTGNGTFCEVSTLNFCYRLSITFDEATSGDTSSRANDADTAVNGFLNELVNGNVGFSYANFTYTFEAVLGNNTVTEFIVELCLNESSQNQDELTATLADFNFTTMINGNPITVLEYDECLTNYGNCSTDASCANTNGSYICTCFDTHHDQSMSGMNGTVCELPTNFTCSSNTVNVTAFNPYFANLGINHTELYLGDCPGTLEGDEILYFGECNPVIENNGTYISYKWNLTNVNETSDITIGNFVTIPITCTFLASQNVSFNISSERRDINFGDDLNNGPGTAYDFVVEPFQNSATTLALNGPVNTNTAIFFRCGTTNTLPSNVRIQVERFTTSSADDSSSLSLTLMNNGCPEVATDVNRRVLNTLSIIRNGITSNALVRVDSHFFGQSTVTRATFEVNACVESGGASSCEYNCGGSRRKRHVITSRVKRQDIEGTGEVQTAFSRSPGDDCERNCGIGGICVIDPTDREQCACANGYAFSNDGMCYEIITSEDNDVALNITMIVLIVLAAFLLVIVGILILAFVFRRRKSNRRESEASSYVNTNAINGVKYE